MGADRDQIGYLVPGASEAQHLFDRGGRRRPLEEPVLDHPVVVVELREIRATRVREHHEDARVGPKPLRNLNPCPRGRSRRAADEQALLARQPARGDERVPIRHTHPLVDDGRIERVGPALLAYALDEVRAFRVLLVGREHRAFRVDRHDPRLRAALLEVAADARDRPPCAHGDDDRVDVTSIGLGPELGPGRCVVRIGIRRVRVLVGLEAARDLLGKPIGDGVVALRRVGVDRGRRDHDLGAIRAQHRDLLLAHLVRHDEDAAIAS